jgi:hypothetical protein
MNLHIKKSQPTISDYPLSKAGSSLFLWFVSPIIMMRKEEVIAMGMPSRTNALSV